MSYVATSSSAIVTTSTGAATVYSGVHNGLIQTITIACAGTTSTADVVITGETSGAAILTKANLTKSVTNTFHPRAQAHAVADGATTSGVVLTKVPLAQDRIKVVMLGGGNAQSYTVRYFIV